MAAATDDPIPRSFPFLRQPESRDRCKKRDDVPFAQIAATQVVLGQPVRPEQVTRRGSVELEDHGPYFGMRNRQSETQDGFGLCVRQCVRSLHHPADVLGGRARRPRRFPIEPTGPAFCRGYGWKHAWRRGELGHWPLCRDLAEPPDLTRRVEVSAGQSLVQSTGRLVPPCELAPVVGDPLTRVAGLLRTAFVPFVALVLAGKAARYFVVLLAAS